MSDAPTHWTDWEGKRWRISLMPNALLFTVLRRAHKWHNYPTRIDGGQPALTAMIRELLRRPDGITAKVWRARALQWAPPTCELCDRVATQLVGQRGWCTAHRDAAQQVQQRIVSGIYNSRGDGIAARLDALDRRARAGDQKEALTRGRQARKRERRS